MLRRSTDTTHATPADRAACASLLRDGSRTFHAASKLLPAEAREAATAMYAFCRVADDAVDVDGGRMNALARLRERLALVYAGRPMAFAPDRAFADVVQRFGIPEALPAALLEGFEWDVLGRRYHDFPELCGYAARVAGTVGAMMCLMMGVRSPQALARACDLGVAMQLTNIARDVGEDARTGRLYLPLDWMRTAGIEVDAWMRAPGFVPQLVPVLRRLLGEADVLYARAAAGICELPASCRPGMEAARILYAEIGREVERAGYDSVTRRAIVPGWRKARLVGVAAVTSMLPRAQGGWPALRPARYLVDAAVGHDFVLDAAVSRTLDDRVEWLVDLFHRLETREQGGRPLASAERSA
jgi:phytoene synthase